MWAYPELRFAGDCITYHGARVSRPATTTTTPLQVQAGVYGSVLRDLKAVAAASTRTGLQVVARMKSKPTDDPLFGKGSIRADGRRLHLMSVAQVKSPEKSKKPWDDPKIICMIPAEKAFLPASSDECVRIK